MSLAENRAVNFGMNRVSVVRMIRLKFTAFLNPALVISPRSESLKTPSGWEVFGVQYSIRVADRRSAARWLPSPLFCPYSIEQVQGLV